MEVGDTIEFVNEGLHDLLIFPDQEAFDNCDFSNAELVDPQTYTNAGTAEIIYFGCSLDFHCNGGGMRVKVTFGDMTSAPTASPAPSPSPTQSSTGDVKTISWTLRSYDTVFLNRGDSVQFDFDSSHDVWRMTGSSAFSNCNFEDSEEMPPPAIYSNADVDETVYFACSVGPHCGLGMKVAVVFGDGDEAPPSNSFSLVALVLSLFSCFL